MSNFIEDIIIDDLSKGKHKKIVLRFPPEPNGCLHIGHARAICLNYGLAKKHGGICNLRFDDTNPVAEGQEFVDAIIADLKWLGWQGQIFFASDYFDHMIDAAIRIIKKDKAFVDESTPEQIKDMRGDLVTKGVNSSYRNRTIQENLIAFDNMIKGKYADGAAVLRAKIDMSSPNMNMRDPILYRVMSAKHHRQGDKYKIYPMYDFAHPLEDAIEGITHSCCSLEFEDHRPLYDWVLAQSGKWDTIPHQYEFGRLNLSGCNLSKRHLKKLVEDKLVSGWDDPRMPTLCGIRRKGYTASAIWDFVGRTDIVKQNSTVDPKLLESCIRDELNQTAKRVMTVIDPIQLIITNRPDTWSESLEFEAFPISDEQLTQTSPKDNITISNKIYIDRADFSLDPPPKYKRLTKGGMVRLKSAYIVKCVDCHTDNNNLVTKVFVEIVENSKSGQDSSGIKGTGVIHWTDSQGAIDIVVQKFAPLFDQNGEFDPKSLAQIPAKTNQSTLSHSGHFQFLRHGYYCLDSKTQLVFNEIVSLKDGFKV